MMAEALTMVSKLQIGGWKNILPGDWTTQDNLGMGSGEVSKMSGVEEGEYLGILWQEISLYTQSDQALKALERQIV